MLSVSLALTGNFMSLKSSFLAKSMTKILTLGKYLSTGCKYLTKDHFKHSVRSVF